MKTYIRWSILKEDIDKTLLNIAELRHKLRKHQVERLIMLDSKFQIPKRYLFVIPVWGNRKLNIWFFQILFVLPCL